MKPKLPLLLLRAGLIAISAATLQTSAHAGVSDTEDFDDQYDYYDYDDYDDTETSNYPDVQLNTTTYTSTSTGENSGMTLTTTTTIDNSGVSSTVEVTTTSGDTTTPPPEPVTYVTITSDPYVVADQFVVTVFTTGSDGYDSTVTWVQGSDGNYYRTSDSSPSGWENAAPTDSTFDNSPPPPPSLPIQ